MYFSLLTSLTIGGMITLSIVALQVNLVRNVTEQTMNLSTKMTLDAVTATVENDFMKAGLGVDIGFVTTAQANRFSFRGDITGDGSMDTVTWFYDTATDIPETLNPDDRPLLRIVNTDTTDLSLIITRFDLVYHLRNGTQTTATTDFNLVQGIEVTIHAQSAQPYDTQYGFSSWRKLFYPPNMFY